jgi:hypothetical protein
VHRKEEQRAPSGQSSILATTSSNKGSIHFVSWA